MVTKDNTPVLIGIGAIIVTLGIGTCLTNARIDDGFTNVNRRIDDINRRIDDTNRRMDDGFANVNRRIDDTNERMNEGLTSVNQRLDDVQNDIREIRTMLFEILKNLNPAN